MNRSIQAEGSSGDLKQDRGFRRFMCRGKEKVKAEAVLLAIGYNIEKLHQKIQGERTGTHLFDLKKRASIPALAAAAKFNELIERSKKNVRNAQAKAPRET